MTVAAASTTTASGILPGIALLVGGVGALIGGVAALKSGWRHKSGTPDPTELGADYAARMWIDLLDRYETAEQGRLEAERQRDAALEQAARLAVAYEECNRERLTLLRERMDT